LPDLFKNCSTNYLDEEIQDQHELHPSWIDPNFQSSPTVRFVDEYELISSSSSDTTNSNAASEIEPSNMTSNNVRPILKPLRTKDSFRNSDVPRPEWNENHPYATRFKRRTMLANTAVLESTLSDETIPFADFSALLAEHALLQNNTDGTPNSVHHYAFAAANDDSLHYGQMRKAPDRENFEQDMQREVADLLASKSVTIVRRDSMPSDSKAVPAIWSFRRKQAPDWTITKWKARLCPHGGKQIEGINFWETYAPVVAWSTTRLILILSLITGMKSRQIDYIQAYTQAPIDCEIYMHIVYCRE